jgi:hypothetical protein
MGAVTASTTAFGKTTLCISGLIGALGIMHAQHNNSQHYWFNCDTQHNLAWHNDTENYNTRHNATQHNNSQHDGFNWDTQHKHAWHNDTGFYKNRHNATQLNNSQHDVFNCYTHHNHAWHNE